MTREQSASAVKLLINAIPNAAKIPASTVDVYVHVLQDLEPDFALAVVRKLVNTSEFFPSLAAVRRAIGEVLHGPRRSGAEAWLDVTRKIRTVGYCGKPVFTDPVIQSIVDRWGWVTLCTEGDVVADRARFIEMYDAMAGREREEAVNLLTQGRKELTA